MPTLFYDPKLIIYDFQKRYQITMSLEFAACADKQLTPLFEQLTGLKINKQISVSTFSEFNFSLNIGIISKFPLFIYVNHNWNPVTVTWQSRSGRVYRLADTDIDCQDVAFGLEGLDAALLHRQLYPGYRFPFKLKDLSYELTVNRLNVDCTLTLHLRPEHAAEAGRAASLVDDFLHGFNQASERRGRRPGLVHNWKWAVAGGGSCITFELDLGSAGPNLFKKLLPFLSGLNFFNKTVIE